MIRVTHLDHIVLTVVDIDQTVAFYNKVLGLRTQNYGADRIALRFGNQKINLHARRNEIEPKALEPTPGSSDLCFITDTRLELAMEHVKALDIEIIEGPTVRSGAVGKLESFYFRDPDGNLIEVANQKN